MNAYGRTTWDGGKIGISYLVGIDRGDGCIACLWEAEGESITRLSIEFSFFFLLLLFGSI